MTERYCTETWSPKTSSSHRRAWSNWVISVSPEYSVTLNRRPKLSLVHPIIFPQRLSTTSRTVSNLIFGLLVYCYMRCVLFSHHLMPNLSISSLKKSFRANIQMFQATSAERSTTSFRPCSTRIPTRGRTSTRFLNTQWSTRGSRNCSTSRTSRMSFLTQFFTTKTCSINSGLSRRRRKPIKRSSRKKRQTRRWPRRRPRTMPKSKQS